jgi:fermentation-respiration switch protein FrsA (DUF1100 family)
MNILDQFFVFHPERWHEKDWRAASGLPLEDVWFKAADGATLFGWYVEAPADRPVVIWCHGNAGNIVNRLDNLRFLFRQNLSVFLFDYRGYGKSQNVRPSEEGLYQDAIGAYEYLVRVRRLKPERLIIFGRSLGAAVAADLAIRISFDRSGCEALLRRPPGPLAPRGTISLNRATPGAFPSETDHSRRSGRYYSA